MVRTGKSKKKAETEPERPESVNLTFPRIVLESMPKRIADRPTNGSIYDVSRLLRAGTYIDRAIKDQSGGQIHISLPLESWHFLARQCAGFDTGAFGTQLSAKLAEHQNAPEREHATLARAANDAALKVAADELREREAAEKREL